MILEQWTTDNADQADDYGFGTEVRWRCNTDKANVVLYLKYALVFCSDPRLSIRSICSIRVPLPLFSLCGLKNLFLFRNNLLCAGAVKAFAIYNGL